MQLKKCRFNKTINKVIQVILLNFFCLYLMSKYDFSFYIYEVQKRYVLFNNNRYELKKMRAGNF